MIRIFAIIFFGAGLLACSSALRIKADPQLTPVVSNTGTPNHMDSLIMPYNEQMQAEMGMTIARSEHDFVKGRPNSPLNNWAADALLMYFRDSLGATDPVMSLLNVGGLRSTLNKGEITLADVYKLMPFDNEVVLVRMPINTLDSMSAYVLKSGGEPLAGAHLKGGSLWFMDGVHSDSFWVITSDYLFNGGDKMNFFQYAVESRQTGVLLRNVFITAARTQGTLIYNDEKRIDLE